MCPLPAEEIYEVYKSAFEHYEGASNETTKEQFIKELNTPNSKLEWWGAYSRETGQLVGWMSCVNHGSWTETQSAKYQYDMLRLRPSDAIHYTVLEHYLNELGQKYVCSGSRNISHKTNVQEYKVKEWHFRRAYCHLHIVYNPNIRWIIKCIYPFRKILLLLDKITAVHQFNSLLRMETIVREDKH